VLSFRKLVPPLLLTTALVAAPLLHVRADEGEKLVQESCGACHDAKTRPLSGYHLTREKWKETVERMEGLGAEPPSGKKLSDLLDYLARTHGPESPAPEGTK
jgi:cytochrome c5